MQKTLNPVRPNASLYKKYERSIKSLIVEMHKDLVKLVKSQYTDAPPLAADAKTPADKMTEALIKFGKYWVKRFEEFAPQIAATYVRGAFKSVDSAMRKGLSDVGFSVKFAPTPAMSDAVSAVVADNVALIKSIPDKYLTEVQSVVMQSFANGRDLEYSVKELNAIYPKNAERATLIARDQANKATSVANHARMKEIGIVQAIWQHSHAGAKPRQSHLAANGKKYNINEGCLIDGEYIFPGQLINCRCGSRAVLPGF
jgi:uncharacterized protein with gpF-like domain